MNSLILIYLVTIIHFVVTINKNPGHLKPFGSVGFLIDIKELDEEFPTVLELFTYYLPKSEPILSRQVLINDNHYFIWETDKKLENDVYGLSNTNIQVESFKSKQRQRIQMTFGEFLKRYGKEPLLFAYNVPTVLQKYLVVPKPLQCDIILEYFQSAILVINGINTSPLMFGEDHDRLHCILRGNKRIVLVNTLKYPDVRKTILPKKGQHRGPPINPDKIDFDQFPAFANIDYHIANLKSGDCLFIPSSWIFQERTFENTISVIYNIKHHQALNIDINQLKNCSTYDATFTLDQIDWSAEPQTFRDVIMNLVNSKVKGFDKWQEIFSKHLSYDLSSDSEASAIFEEFYDIVDVDGDGEITTTEVERINGVHQHHITDLLYEMTKVINNKRKTSTPKPVDSEDNPSTQIIENDKETDEYLHLQNDKTDL
ncbi:unnamed protein product [Rotaria sordida]|uniref:EF-hand domain-containing protein n=1 Tax=Rotaria sordida TaxID=392033 RepID=A0A814P203_9BILA|nr:unnamed protein product [Rotaria sordida]CAF1301555.1 unnamed protein product [Rotaria sordida]